jgi:branched-chain amino acid transport system permease protein
LTSLSIGLATLVNGLVLSSMYILVALGFAFLLNILGIVNFAHGAIYMAGGFICYKLTMGLGLNPWLGMVISVTTMSLFGLFLERYGFRKFYGNLNKTLIVCIAVITVLVNTATLTQGLTVWTIPTFAPGILKFGVVSISYERLVTFLVGGVLLIWTLWFIRKTKIGLQMQAVSQDMEGAALQGIDIHRIAGIACVIACGLAAIAGCFMGAYLTVNPYMGDTIMLKSCMLVVLGGVGSIGGIFFAGLLIGTLDAVLPIFIPASVGQAIILGIAIAILIWRPQGFFGRKEI